MTYIDNKILLIRANKGDYKFPGGGTKQGESHADVLKREVMEETGYQLEKVNDLIGIYIERNPDIYDNTKVFEMKSYYYLCDIGDKQAEQALDGYEKELDFQPVWVD